MNDLRQTRLSPRLMHELSGVRRQVGRSWQDLVGMVKLAYLLAFESILERL